MKYRILITCVFLLSAQSSFSESKDQVGIFKCVNNKGATFYNDKPCPVKDKETRLKAVKDPLAASVAIGSTKKPSVKKPIGVTPKKAIKPFDRSKLIVVDKLEGADKAVHELVVQQEKSNFFAGASDADERRAMMNDSYGNPPEGSRKSAGSNMKTQKTTEAMLDAQMEKKIAINKGR